MICRQISEPIDPPAPVTRMTLFVIWSLMDSIPSSTSSLPSKSTTSMVFNFDTLIFPEASSSIEGIVLTFT